MKHVQLFCNWCNRVVTVRIVAMYDCCKHPLSVRICEVV